MSYKNIDFTSFDGKNIVMYLWEVEKPVAIVQITHGISEHADRYDGFAQYLNSKGISVYAYDQRGHGKTAGDIKNVGHASDTGTWNILVNDLRHVCSHIKNQHPNVPFFHFGHSMGSYVLRTYAYKFPKEVDNLIISGTGGYPGLIGRIGLKLIDTNIRFFGASNKSIFIETLIFGDYNKKFKPHRTKKDWLTKDYEVVKKYINDPYCMQVFSVSYYRDLIAAVFDVNDIENMKKMQRKTSIYLFSGDMDPVGNYGKGPMEVYDKLESLNFKDLSIDIYPNGRHEMINEQEKDIVLENISDWILKRI